MKKAAITLLLFATTVFADCSGIWNGKGGKEDPKYGLVPMTAQMTLEQAGSSVSGTLKIGNGGVMKITSGSVSGSQVTIVITGKGGGQMTGSFTQNGAQLTGKMTVSTGDTYDFAFVLQ
jgi:hypothetical protein